MDSPRGKLWSWCELGMHCDGLVQLVRVPGLCSCLCDQGRGKHNKWCSTLPLTLEGILAAPAYEKCSSIRFPSHIIYMPSTPFFFSVPRVGESVLRPFSDSSLLQGWCIEDRVPIISYLQISYLFLCGLSFFCTETIQALSSSSGRIALSAGVNLTYLWEGMSSTSSYAAILDQKSPLLTLIP